MAPAIVETQPQDTTPAPTKGLDRVKQNELNELDLADKFGAPDVYIDGEKDTCWYHWTGSIYVKILRIENRKGCYVIKLRTEPHAELGKHRHRGEVRAYTIKGPWGYHAFCGHKFIDKPAENIRILQRYLLTFYHFAEYDWTGKEGDYITEMPGTIHTLYMGAGSEVVFDVTGSIEFFNDDNTLRETMDGFSFWRMYEEHCKERGLKVNTGLWY